ncbi:hypothetical protein ACWGH2_41760 [Streptomyces sp. NPDC054871]
MTNSFEHGAHPSLQFSVPDPWFAASALPDRSSLLPAKPSVPMELAITRRSRFAVPANDSAPLQARTVARSVIALMIGTGDSAQRTIRRIENCLTELVESASTRTAGPDILCEVSLDSEHVFISVEHDEASPEEQDKNATARRLDSYSEADFFTIAWPPSAWPIRSSSIATPCTPSVVETIADDHGTHIHGTTRQTWAAVRRI